MRLVIVLITLSLLVLYYPIDAQNSRGVNSGSQLGSPRPAPSLSKSPRGGRLSGSSVSIRSGSATGGRMTVSPGTLTTRDDNRVLTRDPGRNLNTPTGNTLTTDQLNSLLNTFGNGTTLDSLNDSDRRAVILDALASGDLGANVMVEFQNGVARLSGFVVTREEAAEIVRLVSSFSDQNLVNTDLRLINDPNTPLSLLTGTGTTTVDPRTGLITNTNDTLDDGRADLRFDDRATDRRADLRFDDRSTTDRRADLRFTDTSRNDRFGEDPRADLQFVNGSTFSDVELRDAVLNLFSSNGVTLDNLIIDASNGRVTLSGFTTPLELDQIMALLNSVNLRQVTLDLTLVR